MDTRLVYAAVALAVMALVAAGYAVATQYRPPPPPSASINLAKNATVNTAGLGWVKIATVTIRQQSTLYIYVNGTLGSTEYGLGQPYVMVYNGTAYVYPLQLQRGYGSVSNYVVMPVSPGRYDVYYSGPPLSNGTRITVWVES